MSNVGLDSAITDKLERQELHASAGGGGGGAALRLQRRTDGGVPACGSGNRSSAPATGRDRSDRPAGDPLAMQSK